MVIVEARAGTPEDLFGFFDVFPQFIEDPLDGHALVFREVNGEFLARFFGETDDAFGVGVEDVVEGRGGLDDALVEQPALAMFFEPKVLKDFVAFPKVAAVEEADGLHELIGKGAGFELLRRRFPK